ncbi:MAG TPA: L,D-transpeptidase family protein [Bryobacteraceae bacterium]|nr:L,D-transpeptidase family protein [Bryobacteraceae bacterium]
MRPLALVLAALALAEHPVIGQEPGDQKAVLLRQLVDTGTLECLRWPNFSNIQADVRRLYVSIGYSPAWVRDGAATVQARQVARALENAAWKGLDPEDYDGSRWEKRLENLSAGHSSSSDLVQFDLALTISVMRYASDLHSGKVNPQVFCFGLDISQKQCDLAALLRDRLMHASNVQAELEKLEPPFEGYRRTEAALQRYSKLAREDDGELLPATSKPVEPSSSYPGAARLARLLRLLGDLPASANVPQNPHVYEGALVDAVMHFQVRHGIDPDGRIGKTTLEQLNTPLRHRVRQLQLVLERWRWVPDSFPRPPIVVNIPEFRLRAYDDRYRPELEMKVIVGKAYRRQTPVFANMMTHVIFRPYWNVPLSIQRNELVPDILKKPNYLEKNGYEVVDSREHMVSSSVTPELIAQLRSGKLSIRQIPGDKNALGLVKFLFPNEYSVYLHGTPAKSLFAKSRRDFSHGCIRVEKPDDLALWVLRGKPDWDLDRIRAAENGTKPLQVNLDRPIPVLVVYGTAVVIPNGDVHFFDDIYGHDKSLEELLDSGYPYSGAKTASGGLCRRPRE